MFLLAVASAPASAQPVTHPERTPCRVTFAYAPDDVRAEIEAWVRAEPRCARELEIRAVPTEGGLYLLARDGEGHVRERVVPDAQAAAVLVVSWIADDSVGPTPVIVEPSDELRRWSAPPAPIAPPALPPLGGGELGLIRRATPGVRAVPRRWLMLGGVAGGGEVGARGQLELFVRGRWGFGVSGAWLQAPAHDHGMRMAGGDETVGRAVAYVAREIVIGPVAVRAQLGFGAELRDGMMDRSSLAPVGEAALLVTVPLGPTWGLAGGPVVDVSATDHPDASVGVFLGLARRL